MKKLFGFFSLIVFCTIFYNEAVANLGGAAVAAGASQELEQKLAQTNSCNDFRGGLMRGGIDQFCTKNPLYDKAQSAMNSCQLLVTQMQSQQSAQGLNGGPGIGTTANAGTACVERNQADVQATVAFCQKAQSKCEQVCQAEFQQLAGQPGTEQIQQKYQDISNNCSSALAQTEKQAKAFNLNSVGPLLAAISQAAALLGVGRSKGGDINPFEGFDDDEDPCAEMYGDDLIACNGSAIDNPSTGRASVGGNASLIGKPSLGLDMPGVNDAGLPGGEPKDKGSGSGAGNGFNAAGLAALGASGGTGGGGVDGGEGEGSGLDTQVNTGTYGAMGGGGSGGGSSRAGAGSFFNGSKPFKTASLDSEKAKRNRNLNKFKVSQKRKLASEGGANGPFDSNWRVVKEAYKKNSSSLFHQQ